MCWNFKISETFFENYQGSIPKIIKFCFINKFLQKIWRRSEKFELFLIFWEVAYIYDAAVLATFWWSGRIFRHFFFKTWEYRFFYTLNSILITISQKNNSLFRKHRFWGVAHIYDAHCTCNPGRYCPTMAGTRFKPNSMSWKIYQNVDLDEFCILLRTGWLFASEPRSIFDHLCVFWHFSLFPGPRHINE